MSLRQGAWWLGAGLAVASAGLVVVLALSPLYGAPPGAWEFAPGTLVAPLRSYLFRTAVRNTVWLALGATGTVLALAALWARLGAPRRGQALLLWPCLLPGAVTGLLWRPLLEPWLVLAQAEIALLCTGLVIVWQTLPVATLILAAKRRAWPLAAALPLLWALGDAGLVLTLTRGEPFNASHTWASWLLTNLWVGRAWGLAAAMSLGLALVVACVAAVLVALCPPRELVVRPAATPTRALRGAGLLLALVWGAAPFVPVLASVLAAPGAALRGWLAVGGAGWLLQWGLVVGLSAGVVVWAARLRSADPGPPRGVVASAVQAAGMAALPPAWWLLWPVALVVLRQIAPWLASPYLLVAPVALTAVWLLRLGSPHGVTRLRALGLCAFLVAQAFALELALGYTPGQALPTLGTVMTLAEGAAAPQGFALLMHAGLALGAAWALMMKQPAPQKPAALGEPG